MRRGVLLLAAGLLLGGAAYLTAQPTTISTQQLITQVGDFVLRAVTARAICLTSTGTNTSVSCGVGVDSTTVNSGIGHGVNVLTTAAVLHGADYRGLLGPGRRFLAWLEYGGGSGTQTWYGDAGNATLFQTGIQGEVWN